MPHPFRLIPTLLLCVSAFSLPCSAQPLPDDDGLLYFPPKLTVNATGTNNLRPRASDRKNTGQAIVFRRSQDRRLEFLLPMIFFDGAGSVNVPDRYQVFFSSMETDDYIDSGDVPEVPDRRSGVKYLQILNVLGYRMAQFPASRIELEGGYSTLPGENPEVGQGRAETVRDYLTTIWKIEPERIGLRPPRLLCDSAANIFRQEEAQRVTIIPTMAELIRPVRYAMIRGRDELTYFRIVIDPAMDPADVADIELAMSIGDQVISTTTIPGHPDSAVYNMQGMWPAFQLQVIEATDLVVQAFVRTQQGTLRPTNAVRLPIETDMREREDYEPEDPFASTYFQLPFFDWRDSTLSGLQQYYLEEYIRAFRANAEMREGQPYNIKVNPNGDLAENILLDEAIITNTRAMMNIRSTAIGTLFSPHSRFPIIFTDQNGETDEDLLVRTWLGEDYYNQMQEQRNTYSGDYTEPLYPEFDSTLQQVVAGRGNVIAAYLQQRIGASLHDSVQVGEIPSSSYSYRFLPEERYYERCAHIMLEPYYEWNEEDYEYPDEEYVPEEGEYQEYQEGEAPEGAEEE